MVVMAEMPMVLSGRPLIMDLTDTVSRSLRNAMGEPYRKSHTAYFCVSISPKLLS